MMHCCNTVCTVPLTPSMALRGHIQIRTWGSVGELVHSRFLQTVHDRDTEPRSVWLQGFPSFHYARNLMQRLPAKIDRERELNKIANSFKKFLISVLEVLLLPQSAHTITPQIGCCHCSNSILEKAQRAHLFCPNCAGWNREGRRTWETEEPTGEKDRCKSQGCQGEGNHLTRETLPGAQGPQALLKERKAVEKASEGAHEPGATGRERGDCRFVLMKIEWVMSVTANKKKKKMTGETGEPINHFWTLNFLLPEGFRLLWWGWKPPGTFWWAKKEAPVLKFTGLIQF